MQEAEEAEGWQVSPRPKPVKAKTAQRQIDEGRRDARFYRNLVETPEGQKGGPANRSARRRMDKAQSKFLKGVRRKKAAGKV